MIHPFQEHFLNCWTCLPFVQLEASQMVFADPWLAREPEKQFAETVPCRSLFASEFLVATLVAAGGISFEAGRVTFVVDATVGLAVNSCQILIGIVPEVFLAAREVVVVVFVIPSEIPIELASSFGVAEVDGADSAQFGQHSYQQYFAGRLPFHPS